MGRMTFAIEHLLRLREKAGEVSNVSGEGPDGWTVSEVDPTAVVAVFDTLRVAPEYRLCAYQYRERGNGNAFVYAIPTDVEVPDPAICARRHDRFLSPPEPSGALDNVMLAIEGDDSPLSYLHASLLKRELAEFGALWHGCSWCTEMLLDHMPRGAELREHGHGGPGLDPDVPGYWEWRYPQPKRWGPTVTTATEKVRVSFYTHGEVGKEHIVRHTDTYTHGVYTSVTRTAVIAWGQSRIVF